MTPPTRVLGPGDAAYAGQKHYTPTFLKVYDPVVLGLFSRIWRCPSPRILKTYQRHVGRRHLDVGPGTGYFLQRITLPPDATVTLLDPNTNVLSHASMRLAHLDVETVEGDVLQPLPELGPFDSIGLNYVLHCLPGPMPHKADAVANLAAALHPDGVLFGATVLGEPPVHTRLSGLAMRVNNRRSIFDNLTDTATALQRILNASFDAVELELVGSVAIFTAHAPHQRQ